MRYFVLILNFVFVFLFFSCTYEKETPTYNAETKDKLPNNIIEDSVIVDCDYTFEEAIEGTKAPFDLIDQLQLIKVRYYSIDGKIHEGQVLTNKKIAKEIIDIFDFMFQEQFPIAKAIPIVKYDWNDNLSMQDNNTYSFCYRNISYSKHAQGMAIDINPFFNPVRSKNDSLPRPNKPIGSEFNPSVPGTLYSTHPIVIKLKNMDFKWGHYFKRKYDDHHFEK